MIYWALFYEFFKVGLFAIGGGLAALPFLYDIAARTGWFADSLISNMIAISESTPGPIGVNMATYAGFETAGIVGGIIATVGLVCPSVLIILILSRVLEKFRQNVYIVNGLYGLRPAVTALIASAGLDVVVTALLNKEVYQQTGGIIDLFRIRAIILFVLLFLMIRNMRLHPVIFIIGSAVIGIIFKM